MRNVWVATIVGLALTATPAVAKGAKKAGRSAMTDQAFVTKAAEGGMAEVELGKLAEQKGTSDQVKKFGQRMVDDHGKANGELKTIAQKKNITLPSDIGPHVKAVRDRLSKLSGQAFDRAYMREMLTDHRKDANEFKHEAREGKDAEIKAFAEKTLPTVEDHLKLAQDANRAVGTSGTVSRSR